MPSHYAKVRENGKHKQLHVVIAEKALGRKLKGSELVHHADGDKFNNSNK